MPKIKICGLSRPCDAAAVNEAGADYAGFVFAPKSSRAVTAEQAGTLRNILSPRIITVGVFVNAGLNEIAALYERGIIGAAQLHGGEDGAYISDLKKACGIPIIKAVRIGEAGLAAPEGGSTETDYILFDSGAGSGHTFDWASVDFRTASCGKRWFLAGGLTVENAARACALEPFAIDVSSGVETNGQKDRAKILAFCAACRGASSWR